MAPKRAASSKSTTPSKTPKKTSTPLSVATSELDAISEASAIPPFKNPEWSQGKGLQKRRKWKNWKQIIDLTMAAHPEHNCKPDRFIVIDATIAAPPSVKPKVKYCDITGLPTNYTDPKTGLRYYDASVYQYIKGLSPQAVQHILSIRNAGVILK